ncbi:MAG TPA: glycerol kinase GlpK [bacterium]|nr:glycerol kinase GlpK [bacterium]HPN44035.1 glycerol kinase GlpK [bacterium]
MDSYILALDQGTTSSRAIVFDHSGNIITVAQKAYQQHFPKPGWVEHDPLEIWQTQLYVAQQALQQAGITGAQIHALGITNQRETTIVWDRTTGKPVHNAIVWQDRRTAELCKKLADNGFTDLFKKKTGLLLDAYFSGTKIKWILDNVTGARVKAEQGQLAFGTVDSWLVWNLTGGACHVTDVSNASRTLLFNIHSLNWDDELLDVLTIPRSLLPEVHSSSEVYGSTAPRLFDCEIPIAGMAGDQQAALFGQTCFEPGMMKNTYGTGSFIMLNTGSAPVESHNNLLTTIAWQIQGQTVYALEGSVFIAGAVIQWLRDELHLVQSSAEIEKLAASVPDNGGVYLVPAFAGLGAPYWDQFARGTIIGLTRGSSAGHIARAALEAIAFQVKDVLDAMQSDARIQFRDLRVDGGASANNLLLQFQADLINIPVIRPRTLETTALGAAYLAGLATGYWQDQQDIKHQWQIDHVFRPQMEQEQARQLVTTWRKAVSRARHWVE